MTAIQIPTKELIENKLIIEGQQYDFKEEINLADIAGKTKFINDVVAFLNAGPGHLIVGVREKDGVYQNFRPLTEDTHKLAERIQSTIQSNIDPFPKHIETHSIEVDGGHVIDIRIPKHRMQPYQNKITGGFYLRTDRQNKPIPRNEIWSHFKHIEDYQSVFKALIHRCKDELVERGIISEDGPILTISILPREHFDDHPRFEDRSGNIISFGPAFPFYGHHSVPYRACAGGLEANCTDGTGKVVSRFFVSDEWFIHATVAHPFRLEPDDRVGIDEMRPKLLNFMERITDVLRQSDVCGPFCISADFS